MTDDDNLRHLPRRTGQQIPDRDDRDWVTSQELIDEAGISYRQLDYWTRTGLLVPLDQAQPGSGYPRRFPDRELERARVIHDLLDAGVSLQIIRRVVDQVTDQGAVDIGAVTITHHPKETA